MTWEVKNQPTGLPSSLDFHFRYLSCLEEMSLFTKNRCVNPWSAKLNKLNFHPFEVVSRYRDPQLLVSEKYSYLLNLRQTNLDV